MIGVSYDYLDKKTVHKIAVPAAAFSNRDESRFPCEKKCTVRNQICLSRTISEKYALANQLIRWFIYRLCFVKKIVQYILNQICLSRAIRVKYALANQVIRRSIYRLLCLLRPIYAIYGHAVKILYLNWREPRRLNET